MKKIVYLLIVLFILSSCEKIIPDLPRNNPYDVFNDSLLQNGVSLAFMRYEVVGDNNSDDKVNPGETVFVRVYLINYGEKKAENAYVTFSSENEFIDEFIPETPIIYPTISGNSTSKYGVYGSTTNNRDFTLQLTVSEDAPVNTNVAINMTIQDDNDRKWNTQFNIPIVKSGANIEFSKYTVAEDNNADQIVNKGETTYLLIYLKNTGISNALNVKAVCSTNDTLVSNLFPVSPVLYNSGSTNYTNLYPSYERYGYAGTSPANKRYSVAFDVASTAKAGDIIQFNLDIEDEAGNQWQDSFSVNVQQTGGRPEVSLVEIADETIKDNQITAGETIYLRVYLQNTGTSRVNHTKGRISTTSSQLTQLTPTIDIPFNSGNANNPNLSPGYERYGFTGYSPSNKTFTVQFQVDSNASPGSKLPFMVDISDKEGNDWQDDFELTIQ